MEGETGEETGVAMALLAVSERDPGGDELIWTGATAPSSTNTREEIRVAVVREWLPCCFLKGRTKTVNIKR